MFDPAVTRIFTDAFERFGNVPEANESIVRAWCFYGSRTEGPLFCAKEIVTASEQLQTTLNESDRFWWMYQWGGET